MRPHTEYDIPRAGIPCPRCRGGQLLPSEVGHTCLQCGCQKYERPDHDYDWLSAAVDAVAPGAQRHSGTWTDNKDWSL